MHGPRHATNASVYLRRNLSPPNSPTSQSSGRRSDKSNRHRPYGGYDGESPRDVAREPRGPTSDSTVERPNERGSRRSHGRLATARGSVFVARTFRSSSSSNNGLPSTEPRAVASRPRGRHLRMAPASSCEIAVNRDARYRSRFCTRGANVSIIVFEQQRTPEYRTASGSGRPRGRHLECASLIVRNRREPGRCHDTSG